MREDQLKKERKYIEISYDAVSQGYLREFCLDNNFDLTVKFSGQEQDPEDFDFHSTVFFSTSEHHLENTSYECSVYVKPKGFALFGENQNILVMEVESDELLEIRKGYENEHNMQDEWPSYRPHITLSYNYDGELPTIELPDFELHADQVNIKSQVKSND